MVICLEQGARLAYGPADATATHRLFASVKSRLVLPFSYRLTRVVPEKGPLNVCVCVCVCMCICLNLAFCQFFCVSLSGYFLVFLAFNVLGLVSSYHIIIYIISYQKF